MFLSNIYFTLNFRESNFFSHKIIRLVLAESSLKANLFDLKHKHMIQYNMGHVTKKKQKNKKTKRPLLC